MVQYDVRQTKFAKRDLNGILRYISEERKEPEAAWRMEKAIDDAIESLSFLPRRCALIDNDRLKAKGLRMLPIKSCIAFFTIDEQAKTVYIERILHSRRDWLGML